MRSPPTWSTAWTVEHARAFYGLRRARLTRRAWKRFLSRVHRQRYRGMARWYDRHEPWGCEGCTRWPRSAAPAAVVVDAATLAKLDAAIEALS